MPASTSEILKVAAKEWEYWGKSTWDCIRNVSTKGHLDDDKDFAQYVIDTYFLTLFPKKAAPSVKAIQCDKYFWSAITVSYILKTAGFTKEEFPFSQAHATYLIWAIKNQKRNKAAAYWGYRIDDSKALPDVGDLIGCATEKHLTRDQVLAYFDKTESYHSHADIVVAKRDGEIDVIGGNVMDSVTKKTLALNRKGQLVDNKHYWFVVLKRQP